ncbi:AbrB/MazE/SpoVT family DNA-binding domain-containing protein [Paenibacillus psychroresistens]|uniref:AbrB/MazE/SpoVT family DNA-binding domain-containing protein n=1 Tax=Paenibacillus psychroresistens TaxID=1778678 RepID=A0A6B8RJU6_9BACL|nr:AbrB/MazE/SpoVT family DNA-binding domain-containing protein [Paenibacillus psychroresistens]QGQ95833.1 AbrB/MazE/SpoVT family DNA-binding domain-containing protein [Paenibacillus psychroresistens]
MKATGVVRKLDELGRITLPIELRRSLGIGEKDALEIFVDSDRIMLKKYAPGCNFCGSIEQIESTKNGKLLCGTCITEIKAIE